MKLKKIESTSYAAEMDMGGIPVRQALPTHNVEQIDPFILLHHGSFPAKKGGNPMQMGVGPHPHRGFAPLSIVLDGEVHHRDSLGNSSIIGKGGIQWVHAGRGIIHSERPSAALAQKGGAMEVIQLWINLPASAKMDAARYYAASSEQLPQKDIAEDARIFLIAGTYQELQGAVKASSPMLIARISVKAGAKAQVDIPAGFNSGVYIPSGNGNISGFGKAETLHLYGFSQEGEGFEYTAETDTELVLISGEAIDEPMAQYGPFVMNNQTQILEAMRDYQAGKMGVLIES